MTEFSRVLSRERKKKRRRRKNSVSFSKFNPLIRSLCFPLAKILSPLRGENGGKLKRKENIPIAPRSNRIHWKQTEEGKFREIYSLFFVSLRMLRGEKIYQKESVSRKKKWWYKMIHKKYNNNWIVFLMFQSLTYFTSQCVFNCRRGISFLKCATRR